MSAELSVTTSFANCLAVVHVVSHRGTPSSSLSSSLVSTSDGISSNSAPSSSPSPSSSSLDSSASDSSELVWRFPFFRCCFFCFFMSPYEFTSKTHSLSTQDLGKFFIHSFIDSFIHLSTPQEPFTLNRKTPVKQRKMTRKLAKNK